MMTRAGGAVVLALLAGALVLLPGARGDDYHRNGFSGKVPFFIRGDANIHFEEKAHRITDEKARNATTSEYIKIEANPAPGATDAEYVHYYYESPAVPVSSEAVARLWLKGFKAGAQIKARVVLPREKDPRNPAAALTTIISGDTYTRVQQWQQLSIGDPKESLRKHLPVLHARVGRAVDTADAYIDRIVLNVFGGAGISEYWIDDLEIGPVPENAVRPVQPGVPGTTTSQPGRKNPVVEFANGDILVDGKPFFMRAIRHTDTPLWVLDVARFNTIWFPSEVKSETYDEAIRAKFFLVPTLPIPLEEGDNNDPARVEKDAEAVAKHLRKFMASDAVLMWDFGSGRMTEQIKRVARVADVVKNVDPKRPRAIDLWDGNRAYSSYVDAIGAHRWPLFTSLELRQYHEWLNQRKSLTLPGKLSWTWIQTHLPEWYQQLNFGQPDANQWNDPIGPHPEQIRILTYLALASGYRGIGYWSDKFLSDNLHGRDRLLEIALLNAEMELLEPVMMTSHEPAKWYPTSDPHVKAAVIRGPKELIVLPIWMGMGNQFCPETATLGTLRINVPLVPDGAIPWLITPAGVDEIKDVRRVPAGTEITLREFDTTAAIVFTTDLAGTGKVVRWQDNTRHKLARTAAHWAHEQAVVQFNKTLNVHQRICAAGGPLIPEAAELFREAKVAVDRAKQFTDNLQPDMAYREARRALRPLRTLMREHWRLAAEKLDVPNASPYAVSFYSLPAHYELAKLIQASRPAGTALPHGEFELADAVPREGAAVSSLPGWLTRKAFLDPAVGLASIVDATAEGVADPPASRSFAGSQRFRLPGRAVPTAADQIDSMPKPTLGRNCLRLVMQPKKDPEGETKLPNALERSFVAVDSPLVELPPGTWVRISFWVKIDSPGVLSTADGAIVYDTVGGEPLAIRIREESRWRQYHIYRQMPESGKIGMTFALTGFGTVYFDDVKIEPMVAGSIVDPKRPGMPASRPNLTAPSLPDLLKSRN